MSIQGRVEAGNQKAGHPALAPPSEKPANLSVTYSDSTLCMEGQCGHMSAHVGTHV